MTDRETGQDQAAGILAAQAAMAGDLTAEERARYEAAMNPHADCAHAPYCAIDHL